MPKRILYYANLYKLIDFYKKKQKKTLTLRS